MDQLTLGELKLFTRVAALGSLSAVARERHVAVSQVSRALARIEAACGARLVHRSTHALALSAEGEALLEHCRRIVGTVEELEGEFHQQAGTASGLVRVAASTVIAQHLIVPSLAGLHERHPRLRVEVAVSDQLVDMTRDAIDIAIRTGATMPEQLVARPIGQLGRALYAAPAYAQRHGLPARPADLAQHALVTNSAVAHLNQWPFVVEGAALRHAADGRWRSNDTGLAAQMVLQGLGIGRLSTLAAEPLLRAGRLLAVLPEFVDPQPLPVYAVYAGARGRLPKIRACVDWWADWFASASALTPPAGRTPASRPARKRA